MTLMCKMCFVNNAINFPRQSFFKYRSSEIFQIYEQALAVQTPSRPTFSLVIESSELQRAVDYIISTELQQQQ